MVKIDRVSTRRTSNNESEEENGETKNLRSSTRGVKRNRVSSDSDPNYEGENSPTRNSNHFDGNNSSEENGSEEEEEEDDDSSDGDGNSTDEYEDFVAARRSTRKSDAKSQRRSPRQKTSVNYNSSWIFATGRTKDHPYTFRSSAKSKSSHHMDDDDDDEENDFVRKKSYSPRSSRRKQQSSSRIKEEEDDDEDETLPTESNPIEDNEDKDSDEAQLGDTRMTRRRQIMDSPASTNHENSQGSSTSTRYPRRKTNEQESEAVPETPTENGTIRRSQRRSKREVESNLDESQTSEATGDMYTRLKRKTRRAVSYNERQPSSSSKVSDSCEPVARRLRERKTRDERPSLMENILEMDRKRRRRRKRRRSGDSSSSSSSSSSSDEKAVRGNRPRQSPHEKPEKVGSKKGFLDITPIAVDPTITFESVGGLETVIEKLREIVVLPLIYKDFYTARNITPPRGILFHGPPGTGKTLLARALANECSDVGGRKVSFFVRKGADLLNKWVGESERHLRQLFEAASRCQPSIIFFDEIDGLAPARSSKTDQVHNSVVSTLLAELDGVQDRGDIIIIGATNRIDSLDPALRRPGRFDHEFPFLLPTKEGREQIIKSHVSKWSEGISEQVITEVASRCVGFSGADLKLLCAESSMCALRRRYPQIYTSKQRYLLNYESVEVGPSDWYNAMKKVSRSSDRSVGSTLAAGIPLPKAVAPLLAKVVDSVQMKMKKLYALEDEHPLLREPAAKRFLIYTRPDNVDNGVDQYIVPAVLHIFESAPVFTLSLESFSVQDTNSDCKTIAQVFAEAGRVNKFCIVLIPSLNLILKMISEQSQKVLYQRMMSTEKPILILATAQPDEEDLPDGIVSLFNGFSHEVSPASRKCRKSFLEPVFSIKSFRHRVRTVKAEPILEDLPLAPPVPKKVLTPEELKFITKKETTMLRSLRKFLREVLAKLARNKKYCDFTTPVDAETAPDYRDIIEHPMDFETMMCKLDQGVYNSAEEFLADIHLIRDNAVAYNPTDTYIGKSIIHRAHELVDFAHLIIQDEMDSDFEEACQNITKQRKERAEQAATVQEQTSAVIPTETKINSKSFAVHSTSERSSVCLVRLSDTPIAKIPEQQCPNVPVVRRKGRKGRKKLKTSTSKKPVLTVDEELTESILATTISNGNTVEMESDDQDTTPGTDCTASQSPDRTISLISDSDSEAENSFSTQFSAGDYMFVKCTNYATYEKELSGLFDAALDASENMGILRLLDFRYQLMYAVEQNYDMKDKKNLMLQFKHAIKHFGHATSQVQQQLGN